MVSGAQSGGVTHWVAVRSVAGLSNATLFAPPDWAAAGVALVATSPESVGVAACGEHCWGLSGLRQGELVVIYPKGKVPTGEQLTLKPAAGDPKSFNWWGQHEGGAGRD